MLPLTKEQAGKMAEIASEVYVQGGMWVMKEFDFETGVYKLNRCATERLALQKLRAWRKEKIEQLLRSTPEATAYAVRSWYAMPNLESDEGVWRWAHNYWYTTREEAEEALEKVQKKISSPCEIFEMKMGEIPGHFVVA